MLFHEMFEVLHVQAVVHVWVELQCRCQKKFVAQAYIGYKLLIFHVVVGQAGQLASFPTVMTDVKAVMEGPEEDDPVHDK